MTAEGKGGAPPASRPPAAAAKPAPAPPPPPQKEKPKPPPARRQAPQPQPPAPKPPSVAERNVMALEAQTAELGRIRGLLEQQERERRWAEPKPGYRKLDQRMATDGGTPSLDGSLRWLWLLKLPAMAAQVARIPDSYWNREAQKEQGVEVVMAVVNCPCGTDCIVELGASAECAGTLNSGGPCKRLYIYLADKAKGRVFVANSPKKRKPPWEAIVDDYRSSRADA